jgi:hypothetical protein
VNEGWGKPAHSALEYAPCVCRTCYWALFTRTGPAGAAAFPGGTGRTGPFHSTSPTFRSKCPRGTVFVTWNLCPSAMHAYSSSLPLYLMKDLGWDPIKDIKKFDEFYFPKKIAILVELIHSKNQIIIIIKSLFFGLQFAKFGRKLKH